jgi:hypothetical protein
LIVADGFSCREQIAQGTPRRALHLAQVAALALHMEQWPAAGEPAESRIEERRRSKQRALQVRTGLLLGAAVLGGMVLLRRRSDLVKETA